MKAAMVCFILLCSTLAPGQSDHLVKGLESFRNGDMQGAERELREAVKTGGDPRADAFLGITLASTGRCDEALPSLTKSLGTATGEAARLAGLALAQCQLSAGRVEDASALLVKLKASYPNDADVLYLTARLHTRAWNDTVYQLYQKAPASFRVNQLSGEILEMQGQFTEAAGEYSKALEKNPKALNLHFRLGRAILMGPQSADTLNRALKEFEAELSLNPSDAVAHYQVAQILVVQQKPQEAALRFQRALEIRPDFTEVLIALGKLRLDAKNNDEAILLLERAVKLAPRSEAAHYSLMMAYRNARRTDDARRQKAELDKLQKAPEGEFSEFLKKLGEKAPEK